MSKKVATKLPYHISWGSVLGTQSGAVDTQSEVGVIRTLDWVKTTYNPEWINIFWEKPKEPEDEQHRNEPVPDAG